MPGLSSEGSCPLPDGQLGPPTCNGVEEIPVGGDRGGWDIFSGSCSRSCSRLRTSAASSHIFLTSCCWASSAVAEANWN